jgi:nitrite reductase (cytochrome c-552)
MLKNVKSLPILVYIGTTAALALASIGVLLLLQNINTRQIEGRQDVFRVVALDETVIDPAVWGQNFPYQYDTYKRTVDIERTRYGGSEAIQKLDDDTRWRTIFAGMPFGVDYREERGHAFMLVDQKDTERVKQFKQPGACLHCHASVIPAYQQAGVAAGVPNDDANRAVAIQTGFEILNSKPYSEVVSLVEHPITCNDCHDPKTMQLRITRPGFLTGINTLARSNDPVPHFPSIERWRAAGRQGTYDPNTLAERQEMRSFVCGQCHVEYYFAGKEKLLTYPWQNGLKVEQIEAYYNEIGWKDWTHKSAGTASLKAQHPEFEMWSQGIHARSGVSCSDCHMPYTRQGAVKVSDHLVRSPMLNVNNACQSCHKFDEAEMKARVDTVQNRTRDLMIRSEEAVVALINDIAAAKATNIAADKIEKAQALHRQAQWRLDYVAAENSMGFHAPQEAARILAESIDLARQGQLALK